MNNHFLPTNLQEAKALGWNELDVILISGDAYIDHPSFGQSIIGRFLESLGLKVGIISQPDWHSSKDFMALGKPKLFFGVTAGNLDSMVALYTSARKLRSDDPYTEGGVSGKKPYLPTIIYTNRLKEVYKDVPIVVGGIEASLRRVSHYDYYQDKIRPSILLDAKADLLVFGNGEKPLEELVTRLKAGEEFKKIKDIRGTVVPINQSDKEFVKTLNPIELPKHEEVAKSKEAFLELTKIIFENINPFSAKKLYQEVGTRGILINEAQKPLTTKEIDRIYNLSFTRKPHPKYKQLIPAYEVIRNSVTSHRGCYGGCSFCALALHQGKFIQNRSTDSVKREVAEIGASSSKPVVITDVGGPSANMYGTECMDEKAKEHCQRLSCIYPNVCRNLRFSSDGYLKLLGILKKQHNIKEVFVNSGIRYDLALLNKDFLWEMVKNHIQGHLSVAPEHVNKEILTLAGKPLAENYENFVEIFYKVCNKVGKRFFLMPYFIVGLPGDNEKSQAELKDYFKKNKVKMRQLQEFYPTPMTLATAMYYTGKNIFTGEDISIEKHTTIKKQWKRELIGQLREGW